MTWHQCGRVFHHWNCSTLWQTNSSLLKMVIEIVVFPIEHGDFPSFCKRLPEGSTFRVLLSSPICNLSPIVYVGVQVCGASFAELRCFPRGGPRSWEPPGWSVQKCPPSSNVARKSPTWWLIPRLVSGLVHPSYKGMNPTCPISDLGILGL